MKKLILSLVAIATITLSSFGQAPEGFKYQAVVRDAGNIILNNQAVGMRMTIQQGAIGGTTVYSETFSTTTNAYGLVNLEIGNGTVVTGTFATIDWANGPYFMETAVDVTGGTSYSVMGTSQLMSVPYALYAKTSGSSTPGPQGPQGIQGLTGPAGADGVDGTDGVDGAQGLQGIQGPTGATGPIGPQGPAGADGAQGPAGPAGADGQGGVTTAGSGINVTGAGTLASPYVVSTTSPCGLAIGQTYQGGIIFYLDASGCHGLISASTNQSTSALWTNGSYMDTRAYGSGLFEGKYNTGLINAWQGGFTSAAAICRDLSLGGYFDWYLPSIEELNKMYQNIGQGDALGLGNVGGFASSYYWSSTEENSTGAWYQNFFNGFQFFTSKSNVLYVRAVRAF
jgi:hypothetical protein